MFLLLLSSDLSCCKLTIGVAVAVNVYSGVAVTIAVVAAAVVPVIG